MSPYNERNLPTITDRQRVAALRAICAKLGLDYDNVCEVEVIGAIHKIQVSLDCLETGLRTPVSQPGWLAG